MYRSANDRTQLSGPLLTAARIGWLTFAVFAAVIFLASIPAGFSYLHTTCLHGACDSTQLSVHRARQLAQLGISRDVYAAYFTGLMMAFTLTFYGVALLIFVRRWNEPAALVSGIFLIGLGTAFPDSVSALQTHSAWQLPLAALNLIAFSAFILFFCLFPDGRFVPRWTGVVAPLAIVTILAGSLLPGAPWNPKHWSTAVQSALTVSVLLALLGGQIYRYIRVSTLPQRQQTKWVVYLIATGIFGFIALASFSNLAVSESAKQSVIGTAVALSAYYLLVLLIPLSIGAAILTQRLWDVDVLINRTLVYGALTVALGLVYVLGVVVMQAAFRALTGQGSGLAIAVSTLGIAVLFQPFRRQIQSFIDRRFYRRKYDAARILARFGERVRDDVDLDELTRDVLGAVQETMQPAHVSLWLRPRSRP